MPKSGEKLHKLFILLVTWALLLVCFAAYQQYFVKRQESFFKERGFRALATVSRELSSKFVQAQTSANSSLLFVKKPSTRQGTVHDYLELYLSEIRTGDKSFMAATKCIEGESIDADVPAPILKEWTQVQDTLALSVNCFTESEPGKPSNKIPISKLDLAPWIRKSFQEKGSDFEDLVVTESTGHVIFQKSSNGPRITDLKSLLPSNNKTPDAQGTGLGKLNDSSAVTDVTLADEAYKMFSEPVSIPLLSEPPSGRTLQFVVAGLRRARNFNSETQALPYSTVIWAALAALALFSVSWPVFKLRYMSNTERFTPKDGWYLVIAVFLAFTSVTLMLLNASYTAQSQHEADAILKTLANQMKGNFEDEMVQAYRQLKSLSNELNGEQKQRLISSYLDQKNHQKNPGLLCYYPYFELAMGINDKGLQISKFDVRRAVTPIVNVRDLALVKNALLDTDAPTQELPPCPKKEVNATQLLAAHELDHAYFQPLFSPNTNEFSAALAAPFRVSGGARTGVQTLTILPMSLIDPVLPPGYRFAVIDANCKVWFHSDSFRNGRENFCEESRSGDELQPRLFGGNDSSLDLSYGGHVERAYLTPFPLPGLSSEKAFLVVFQEIDRELTINLALILICSILLAAYLASLALLAALHLSSRKLLNYVYPPLWLWPCKSSARDYAQLIFANAVMLLLFWLIYPRLYEAPLLALTLATPVLSAMFVFLKLTSRLLALAVTGLFLFLMGALGLGLSYWPPSISGPEWRSPSLFLCMTSIVSFLLSGEAARNRLAPRRYRLIWLKRAIGWTKRFGKALWNRPWLRHSPIWLESAIDRVRSRFSQNNFSKLYVLVAMSLITTVALAPSLGFFKYAYDAVKELSLKHDEVIASERLLDRDKRIREYYQMVQAPPNVIEGRSEAVLDRYDKVSDVICGLPGHGCPSNSEGPASEIAFNDRLERFIAGFTFLFPSNRFGLEMSKLGVASTEGGGASAKEREQPTNTEPGRSIWEHRWHEEDRDPKTFKLIWGPQSTPTLIVKGTYTPWQGLALWAKACLAVLWIVLSLWLVSLVRKIFLIQVAEDSANESSWKTVDEINESYLVVAPAKTGKSDCLWSIEGLPNEAWCDLRAKTKGQILDKTFQDQLGQAKVVVLDHFEFNLRDRQCNLDRLCLLESLLYELGRKVIVVSSVDPLYYITENAPEMLSDEKDGAAAGRLLERWARVLSKLTRVHLKDAGGDVFEKAVTKFKNEHQGKKHAACRDFADWVREECRHTTMLQKIGTDLLEQFKEDRQVTREWLVRNVLDRADVYYHVLWSGMTTSERLVLYQLALDGWANPKNVAALQQLKRKSLIYRNPMYRIMNDSFLLFIESTEHADEIEQWENHERASTWHVLRFVGTALAIGVAVWVVSTQAALSQAVAGYTAGAATLLTAIAGLFGRFPKAGGGQPESSKH